MAIFSTEWDTAPNPTFDVWTTTNGGEILPGVLCPFSATLYNAQDYASLKKLMKAYPSGRSVAIHKPPVGNFFGIAAGRLTLNVGFTVAAMSSLDGDIAAAMAGQFFAGSDDAMRFIVNATPTQRAAAYAVATEQRESSEAEALADQAALYAERSTDRYSLDRASTPKAAWKRLQSLVAESTDDLNRHYVVSTAAGEFQVRLAGLVAAGGGDPHSVIGLVSGLGQVESSKPAVALYQLARLARKHTVVADTIRHGSAGDVLASLAAPDSAPWRAFAKAFAEFIRLYGFRVQGEADPTNADWSEHPEFAVSQIRTLMAVPEDESPTAQIRRTMAARKTLERSVKASLAKEFRPLFSDAVATAQRYTRMRELTKAVWVLGVRRQRACLLAIADGLTASGVLRAADDLRFCTYDEVAALVKGATVEGLAESIKRRRKQWKQAHDYVLPDAYVGSPHPKKKPRVADVRSLTGLGVSIGIATGRARVILNTEAAFERDIEPGEILVAPFTDTPWTPLFIPAGAVVVETGGILSHAATVAREFGIPAVVLVADATRIIRDGDLITVDGAAGTVEIVERA